MAYAEEKAGMTSTQEEIMEISRLHEKYPASLAFRDVYEDVPLELRLKELKLELLLEECEDLQDKRQSLYVKGDPDNIILPVEGAEFENAAGLREKRTAAVRKLMEVPDPEPLILQADVLRDEVDLAGTPFFTEEMIRDYLLSFFEKERRVAVQQKNKCLQRFSQYCPTDVLMEKYRPVLDVTNLRIEEKYDRACGRLAALSANARLNKDDSPMLGVTPRDLTHLLRVSCCDHLYRRRATVFFRKLQYTPLAARFEILARSQEIQRQAAAAAIEVHTTKLSEAEEEHFHRVDGHAVPVLTTNRTELDAELTELKDYWGMTTDIQADDGQEFFYYSNKKFQNVFADQVVAGYFPAYDVSTKLAQGYLDEMVVPELAGKHAERMKVTAQTTYLKDSNWLPFVPCKPSVNLDIVYQKARLQKMGDPDKLLQARGAFVDENALEESAKGLRGLQDTHWARARGVSVLDVDEVKASLAQYTAGNGEGDDGGDRGMGGMGMDGDDDDHGSPEYLSPSKLLAFYFLRHVRTRDVKRKLLDVLNYFRSVERTLTLDAHGFCFEKSNQTEEQLADLSRASEGKKKASKVPAGGPPSERIQKHAKPTDYPTDGDALMGMTGLHSRSDTYDVTRDRRVRVKDSFGVNVMYSAAVSDMEALEEELLLLGTHFLKRDEFERAERRRQVKKAGPAVDHMAVLTDLFESEFWFQETKRKLLDCYLDIYHLTLDEDVQAEVVQTITDLMALRPRVDFTAPYFTESYSSEIVCLELQCKLTRQMIDACVADSRKFSMRLHARVEGMTSEPDGLPDRPEETMGIRLTPSSDAVSLFEFHPSLAPIIKFPALLTHLYDTLAEVHAPETVIEKSSLTRAILHHAQVEWGLLLEEERLQYQLSVGDVGLPNTLEPMMVDDPLAMESVAKQVAGDLRSMREGGGSVLLEEDEEAGTGMQAVEAELVDMATSRPADDGGSDSDERFLLRTLEAVRLRNHLYGALYETEVIVGVYKNQARLMGHDLSKNAPKPLDLDEEDVDQDIVDDQVRPQEVVTFTLGTALSLAISEFDASFGDIDFDSPAGCKAIITVDGLDRLRLTHQCQVVQKNALLVSVQYNQVVLDDVLRDAANREKRLFDQLHASALARSMEGSTKEVGEDTRRRKIAALQKTKHQQLSRISPYFLNLNVRKIKLRTTILSAYMEKYAVLLQQSRNDASADSVPTRGEKEDKLLSLSRDLIRGYCTELTTDMYPFALRSQACLNLERLRRKLAPLPQNDIFSIGKDPDGPESTPLARTESEAGSLAPEPSMLSRDGMLINNLWHLPHYKEVLRSYSGGPVNQQVRALTAMLDIFYAFDSIVAFQSFIVRLGPTYDYLNPTTNLLKVPDVLGELKTESFNLAQKDTPDEVIQFLWDQRSRLYCMFWAALRSASWGFLDRENTSAFQHYLWFFPSIASPQRPGNLFIPSLERGVYQLTAPSSKDIEVVGRTSFKGMSVLHGLFVGAVRPPPFGTLPLLLAQLHDSDRRYVATEFELLEQQLEDLMAHIHVYQQSEPQKAVRHQLLLLRAVIAAEVLRHDFVCRALGIPRVETVEQRRADVETFDAAVLPRLVDSLRKAGLWDAALEQRVGALGAGEYVPSMSHLEEIVPDPSVLRELQVHALKTLISAQLLDAEVEKAQLVRARLAGALDEVKHRETSTRGDGGDGGDGMKRTNIPASQRSKLHALQGFVHSLLEVSPAVPTAKGEASVVISLPELAKLLDHLGHDLLNWGEAQLASAERATRLLEDNSRHLLYVSERERLHMEALRAADRKAAKRRVQTEVADKGYELILELADLYRQLAKVQKTMENQAQEMRAKVKQEYEDQLAQAEIRQTTLEYNFIDYRKFLYEEMQNELHKIKQDTQKKFQEIQRLPVDVKKRAQYISDLEGDLNALREDNSKLEKTILKLKTMSKMKEIASAYSNAKMLRDERKVRFEKTRKLSEMQERMEQGEEMLKQLLASTQRALAAAEEEVEALRKDLELQQRNKKQLVKEKVQKTNMVDMLKAQVSKYERWRHIDVDRLLLELDKKDSELKSLTQLKDQHTRKLQLNDKKTQREIRTLHKQLQAEQTMKNEAFEHIEELREKVFLASESGSRAGTSHSSRPATAADSVVWKQRYEAMLEDFQNLLQENEEMSAKLKGLGVAVPQRPIAPIQPRSGSVSRGTDRPGSMQRSSSGRNLSSRGTLASRDSKGGGARR